MNTKTNPLTCSSCFFPESFPDTNVDENGICNRCVAQEIKASMEKATYSNLEQLRTRVDELRQNKKGKYDCVIGASGGLDSSYVIYIAKKLLDLNPLVISYDHGFGYEEALNNLKKICSNLGIELRVIRSTRKHDQKFVRSMVQALKNVDAYWGICNFCDYIINAVVYKIAFEENAPVILTSTNVFENDLPLTSDFKLKFMVKSLLDGSIAKIPKVIFHLLMAQYHLLNLKLEFYLPPLSNLYKGAPKSPVKKLNVTKYIKWDIEYMVKTMEEQMGWQLPTHPNIQMRFDCKIEDGFLNHTYKKATGMSVQGIIASNLARGGVETKDQLKKAVDYYDSIIEDRKDELMGYLGIK